MGVSAVGEGQVFEAHHRLAALGGRVISPLPRSSSWSSTLKMRWAPPVDSLMEATSRGMLPSGLTTKFNRLIKAKMAPKVTSH